MRRLRVLHCPWNVAGNAGELSSAQRKLGIDSRLVTLRPDRFGFAADEVLTRDDASSVARELARFRLLWRALSWADVVHFNFGQTCFMPEQAPNVAGGFRHSPGRGVWHLYARLVFMRDLALLRAAGKRIAVTFQGDDIRLGSGSRRLVDWGLDPDYYSPQADAWKRRAIDRFVRYADLIYTINIDHLPLLPPSAQYLPYTAVDPDRVSPGATPTNTIPVVAHAPTHRGIKGTKHVLAAIDRLRADGVAVELDLIEGVSHEVALTRYRRADIVVDQLLLGWYGGLGVEVMAMGKPLVVYVHDEDARRAVPAEMLAELPVIRADPWSLTETLNSWLGPRRHELPEVGLRGRRYVERWHDPVRIARRVVGDYHRALGRAAPGFADAPAGSPGS